MASGPRWYVVICTLLILDLSVPRKDRRADDRGNKGRVQRAVQLYCIIIMIVHPCDFPGMVVYVLKSVTELVSERVLLSDQLGR